MDWHQFKIFKNSKARMFVCHFLFLIFLGSRSIRSRKINRFEQKKLRLPPEERFLEPIQKNDSETGDVSQGLCLSKLKKPAFMETEGLLII